VVWRELIQKPNGIILVTGPTSSGKTTTLYATLNELNKIEDKIITTEEPVEYEIEGLIQVPINPDIGVTFAACLRAILRQDPDKILVGETRDLETAEISIQASLTGHIVFTTLHTNDAPSAITRLRDMGLPTFLITATVEGVLAQRLVRKICVSCKTQFTPSPEIVMELGMLPEEAATKPFFYGKGCERCNNTGYKGRMGIYELLMMNDTLREMVVSETSLDEFRSACRRFGMRTLRESGLKAIHEGVTTVEEIVRETILDED
jgi:type IV pilus assembly protein PilB